MKVLFCPHCDEMLSIFTTGFDHGELLMRHYDCAHCGYHQKQPECRECLTQGAIDRFHHYSELMLIIRAASRQENWL